MIFKHQKGSEELKYETYVGLLGNFVLVMFLGPLRIIKQIGSPSQARFLVHRPPIHSHEILPVHAPYELFYVRWIFGCTSFCTQSYG